MIDLQVLDLDRREADVDHHIKDQGVIGRQFRQDSLKHFDGFGTGKHLRFIPGLVPQFALDQPPERIDIVREQFRVGFHPRSNTAEGCLIPV